jgi:hypothetical protein
MFRIFPPALRDSLVERPFVVRWTLIVTKTNRDGSLPNRRLHRSSSTLVILMGLWALGCALGPGPKQMYEGPPRSKEQVGILRNGCAVETGLSIMVMQIDGKNVPDPCADLALLPGDHQLEVGAKQLVPRLQTGTMRSGAVLGAPPAASPAEARREQVIWTSPSTLSISCKVGAGEEMLIVGTRQMGDEWQARCEQAKR